MISDKTLHYLAAAYLVLFLVVSGVENHGLRRAPTTPLQLILIAPMLWFLGLITIQRGSVLWVVVAVQRSKNPGLFWSITTLIFLLGLIFACVGCACPSISRRTGMTSSIPRPTH
jgi:hypothetical protein